MNEEEGREICRGYKCLNQDLLCHVKFFYIFLFFFFFFLLNKWNIKNTPKSLLLTSLVVLKLLNWEAKQKKKKNALSPQKWLPILAMRLQISNPAFSLIWLISLFSSISTQFRKKNETNLASTWYFCSSYMKSPSISTICYNVCLIWTLGSIFILLCCYSC